MSRAAGRAGLMQRRATGCDIKVTALMVMWSRETLWNCYCPISLSFLEPRADVFLLFLLARRVPCGVKDLFNFCWTLFVYTKGRLLPELHGLYTFPVVNFFCVA